MKKLLFLLSVTCLMMSCKTTKQATVQPHVNEEDEIFIEHQNFTIKKGETFEISMLTNASAGMRWEWVNKEKVANIDSTAIRYERTAPADMVGAASRMYWSFTGTKKGAAIIRLEYGRFFPNNPRHTVKIMEINVKVK
ncbi:MAG: protease inhibitor I42 family protein [Bacteroidales bacterium]|jgi:predicted secreted protein|nr:protease inhibitor I42 family protein [Bacteroidales bacterium]